MANTFNGEAEENGPSSPYGFLFAYSAARPGSQMNPSHMGSVPVPTPTRLLANPASEPRRTPSSPKVSVNQSSDESFFEDFQRQMEAAIVSKPLPPPSPSSPTATPFMTSAQQRPVGGSLPPSGLVTSPRSPMYQNPPIHSPFDERGSSASLSMRNAPGAINASHSRSASGHHSPYGSPRHLSGGADRLGVGLDNLRLLANTSAHLQYEEKTPLTKSCSAPLERQRPLHSLVSSSRLAAYNPTPPDSTTHTSPESKDSPSVWRPF